jgi:hypothetical protein
MHGELCVTTQDVGTKELEESTFYYDPFSGS